MPDMEIPIDFKAWLEDHIFTPSELEAYPACPFSFYARSFLKLQAPKQWEVEITPPEAGKILHDVLERFLAAHRLTEDRRILENKLSLLLEESLSEFQTSRAQLSPVLLDLKKQKMTRTLLSFLDHEVEALKQPAPLKPYRVEWSFGGRDVPPLQIGQDRDMIRIRGRIDRIDIDEKNKRFLIIDYKTGGKSPTGNQIRSGEALQLPLYILAVKNLLLPDYEPIGGIYYQLSDMTMKDGLLHADRYLDSLAETYEIGPRSSSLVPSSKWDETFDTIQDRVRSVVSEIHKAEFASTPDHCHDYCAYRDICRIRETTS